MWDFEFFRLIGTIFLPIFPKWYQFCLYFFILFSKSIFFVAKLCFFPKWYLFSGYFFPYKLGLSSLKWYFLLVNFYHFLKWYDFCRWYFALFRNGTIFVCKFWYFSLMVPFFVAEFSHILQLLPYLLQTFHLFLKLLFFSHFAQIGSTVFKATFCIGTLSVKKSKGATFLGI